MNAMDRQPRRVVADKVTMAHGGGGKAMRDLIEEVFTSVFAPDLMEDQARLTSDALQVPGARLAFTTDSFVVDPVEFPGGDIGKIAVCGTVNDLAVGGAALFDGLLHAFAFQKGVVRARNDVDDRIADREHVIFCGGSHKAENPCKSGAGHAHIWAAP